MMRVPVLLIAFLSPFFFPAPLTLVFGLAAGFIFPPLALIVGILVDALFYVPSVGIPLGTVLGGLGSIATFLVRRIIQARIMS